jgi:hypothetical protein
MNNQNNSIKYIIKQAIMEAANSKEDYEKLKTLRQTLNLPNQLALLAEAKTFFDTEKYTLAAAEVDKLIFATKRVNEEMLNVFKVMNRMDMAGEYSNAAPAAAAPAAAAPAPAQNPLAESLRRLLGSSKQRSRRY